MANYYCDGADRHDTQIYHESYFTKTMMEQILVWIYCTVGAFVWLFLYLSNRNKNVIDKIPFGIALVFGAGWPYLILFLLLFMAKEFIVTVVWKRLNKR